MLPAQRSTARDSSHFLGEYLRISTATLDVSAPKRSLRVRSAMLSKLGS